MNVIQALEIGESLCASEASPVLLRNVVAALHFPEDPSASTVPVVDFTLRMGAVIYDPPMTYPMPSCLFA